MYSSELSELGINLKGKISGKFKARCPKCADTHKNSRRQDLLVDIDNGIYRCYSEGCKWKGTVAYQKKYSRPIFTNKTDLSNRLVKYFEGRRISQETLKKFKITEKGKFMEFNYFRNDILINRKTRAQDKSVMYQHKDSQKIPYNIDSIKGKKKVIWTEGEIDALTFEEMGVGTEYGIISLDQGAGSEGSSLEGKLACIVSCASELDEVEEFILAFDDDLPGNWTLKEVARRLGEYRCKRMLFNGRKDANELLNDETMNKEMSIATLLECLKKSKPIPIEGIITLDDNVKTDLLKQYDEGRKKGAEIGIKKLDRHIKYAKDEFTVVTGFANSGKGTFCKFLSLKLSVNLGWKWAIYAPEDFPVVEYYEDICHMYIGKTLDKEVEDRATREDVIIAMDFVEQHYFLVHPEPDKKTGKMKLPDMDWVFTKFRFLKLAYGVNAAIIDPWNKLLHDMGRKTIDLYLADALSELKFYSKGWDHVFLVAHQKSPENARKNLKPSWYRISGGAMWPNMSDNIIGVHRPKREDEKDNTVQIIIEKIKKMKVNGKLGTVDMYFDKGANRYDDYLNDFDVPANEEGMLKSQADLISELPF